MIRAVFYRDETQKFPYRKLTVKGHSLYDEPGKDIICAAVSVLTINLANSVEKLTESDITATCDDGDFSLIIHGNSSKDVDLLFESCKLGFETIKKEYGNNYLKITVKEV